METSHYRKAVFLDRDGTLNKNLEYFADFEHFEFIPGVIPALSLLQQLEYRLFVVSNQSGVARGLFTFQAVETLHRRVGEVLDAHGIHMEEFVFCPHHPLGTVPEYAVECACRKPKPGMIRYLEAKYNLDVRNSFMVGDMRRDAQAGLQAGAMAILLKPDADPNGKWDRVDKQGNIKEFISLLDFAESLRGIA